MGYGDESRQTMNAALPTAENLASTGDDLVLDITQPITVLRIGATITTTIVSSGAVVVKADRRITTGSDTGRGDGDVGVLTIPAGTAAGKIVYKDVAVDLNPGDQIVFETTTAAAGGGAAGGARFYVEYVARHETAPNCADMIESA